MRSLRDIIASYDPDRPLTHASTIPASWYTDPRVAELERRTVFAHSWQLAARVDQLQHAGQFVTSELGDEPVVVVRGSDETLRGFFNVCRHHAAAVVSEAAGSAKVLRCPYHGWTYALSGELKGTPDFAGVCEFDRSANGLVPIDVEVWEKWVLAAVERHTASVGGFLGADLVAGVQSLHLERLSWFERRVYSLDCNWKVFVDNYLDGGYHVPHLHKALDSVLDYANYTIDVGPRHCLQSSPLTGEGADADTRDVRAGDRARYYWIYPNFMINCYAGAMDTNLVLPRGVDRTDVVFDFYFDDVSAAAASRNRASIDVSERIQDEDVAICVSVQRGLRSRAYETGRLSVRREAGEHLFHRLLHADLRAGVVD
jgi:choline monooxygenase